MACTELCGSVSHWPRLTDNRISWKRHQSLSRSWPMWINWRISLILCKTEFGRGWFLTVTQDSPNFQFAVWTFLKNCSFCCVFVYRLCFSPLCHRYQFSVLNLKAGPTYIKSMTLYSELNPACGTVFRKNKSYLGWFADVKKHHA